MIDVSTCKQHKTIVLGFRLPPDIEREVEYYVSQRGYRSKNELYCLIITQAALQEGCQPKVSRCLLWNIKTSIKGPTILQCCRVPFKVAEAVKVGANNIHDTPSVWIYLAVKAWLARVEAEDFESSPGQVRGARAEAHRREVKIFFENMPKRLDKCYSDVVT